MNIVGGILKSVTMNSQQYIYGHQGSYTSNSKISAKREEESYPPPAAQRQTAHQSPLKGGNRNNGVNSSPSFSLELRFSTLRVPSFWFPEGRTSMTKFCRRRAETQSA
jgi:hypothetical protein